jgi:hypothetical protein
MNSLNCTSNIKNDKKSLLNIEKYVYTVGDIKKFKRNFFPSNVESYKYLFVNSLLCTKQNENIENNLNKTVMFIIPYKNYKITLTKENIMLYAYLIQNYEIEKISDIDLKRIINNKDFTYPYTFNNNYCFFVGDNS